jgi:hypothetical protein
VFGLRQFFEFLAITLRIVFTIRYNARNGHPMPNKTVRTGVSSTYTHLTQPTELAADWAGMDFIIPDLSRPGGIPIGAFCVCSAGMHSERHPFIGGYMLTTEQQKTLTHSCIIDALVRFREEWEQVAEGESLVDIKGSVGLILFDLVIALALIPNEQAMVLGSDLQAELGNSMVHSPSVGRCI